MAALAQEALLPEATASALELGQFSTPPWVIEALLQRFFPRFGADAFVVEPSCGEGAWLHALPESVPALGVELDPRLAAMARSSTGRTIVTGDFRNVDLGDVDASHVLGNPPFGNRLVRDFLRRAHGLLREGGQVGFILPAHTLGSASYVLDLHRRFSIEQTMLPRYIWPRLSLPVTFAVFTKERTRRLIGFALYQEFASVAEMPGEYRAIVGDPKRRSAWRDVVTDALQRLGGTATLEQLCAAIEPHRPAETRTWTATVRRVCGESFHRIREGLFSLEAVPA